MDLLNLAPLHFQNNALPSNSTLAGFAAIVHTLAIQAPVRNPSCISSINIKGHIREQGKWTIYSRRYQIAPTIEAHLEFALKHETLDLLVLKRMFSVIDPKNIRQHILSSPKLPVMRRIWFLYEMLTGISLEIELDPEVKNIDLLDSRLYFVNPKAVVSRKHKVRNNLLGTYNFCPIIRKTDLLITFVEQNLSKVALATIGKASQAIIARAASFLLLADSQASFQIEGERPPRNRVERWGRAVMQAGRHELSIPELMRMHNILIEDHRFVKAGFRTDGVFLGERTTSGEPLPEFIGANPSDLHELIHGLLEANSLMTAGSCDAVLQAAAVAFGFVYIHPYEDGNGRIHRFIVHHVLTERRFTPPGMLFPVSSAMLEWIDDYRKVLQAHSAPLMEFIEWYPTERNNVEVVNDTTDLYRYLDCTTAAEFLYKCVARTIEHDLPKEIDYLVRRDEAISSMMNFIEMPDRMAEQFVLYVLQNDGKFPNRRKNEFDALNEDEMTKLENIVNVAFDGFASWDEKFAAH
jgi:hypothetical protein